ncbi:MAG: hypothetical protein EOP07_25770, partial [Proteobacteria bacterium]
RQRYRYYRTDPHLRAAHQQHPWSIVWDNHDICTGASREEAIQAFFEWVPVRAMPEKERIYRSLDFGDLLKVILLDTRHIGRDEFIPGTLNRSILGEDQFHWLKDELKSSTARWNIIVNQVLMSPLTSFGKVLTHDSWDGYPKDRERLLRFLVDEGIDNNIVVSGDAHFSYACNLEIDGRSAGVEFLPTSITRGNLDETVGAFLGTLLKGTFEAAIKYFNPSTRYFESEAHGYGIVDLTPNDANCEFWYVDHKELTNVERCGRAINVASGSNYFTTEIANPKKPKFSYPRLAPPEETLYQKGYEIGGQGGESFDGLERLSKSSRLKTIKIRENKKITSLGCEYEDYTSWQKGSSDGKEKKLELNAGEYLRKMTIGIGEEKKSTLVFYIKLVTSEGRVLEAGTPSPTMIV